MSLLNDPSAKEIVLAFCNESEALYSQLDEILSILEFDLENSEEHLESFGQIIDRVMGTAKNLGAEEIATFCELSKVISYKSSQTHNKSLLNVVIAILFDAVDLLKKMTKQIQTGQTNILENLNANAFASRLRWLSSKFKDIERASCEIDSKSNLVGGNPEDNMNQASIDDLLANLGL